MKDLFLYIEIAVWIQTQEESRAVLRFSICKSYEHTDVISTQKTTFVRYTLQPICFQLKNIVT